MSGASRKSRVFWTKEEDEILIREVAKHGTNRWTVVATAPGLYPKRSAKSCSLRWRANLDPAIQTNRERPFSNEEKRILIDAQARLGNRWYEIAKLLPGRSNTAVKTWWYSSDNPSNKGASGGNKRRRAASSAASAAARRRPRRDSDDEDDYDLPSGSDDSDEEDPSMMDGEGVTSEDYEEVYGAPASSGRGVAGRPHQQQAAPRRGRTPVDSGYTSGGWSDEEERRPRKLSVVRGAPAAAPLRAHSWQQQAQPQVGGVYRPHPQYSEDGYGQYNSSHHPGAGDMEVDEQAGWVKPEQQYQGVEPPQQQQQEEEDRSSYSFLVAHGSKPRTTDGRPRASHHYAVIECTELTSGVDRSTPVAAAYEVKPAGSGQKAAGSGGSPKVAGGLDALLAAVGMVTDEEEAAAAEAAEDQRFQVNLVNARRLPKELYESEEAVAAREHLARAAAAAAEKKAEEQRRRLLAQGSSSSGRVVSQVYRSPARKSSPAVSLVPPPPGLAAIATNGARSGGRWQEDSEGEEGYQQQQQQQQQYAHLPSAGGHAWSAAAARAAAGLGFLSAPAATQHQHTGSGRSPLGRPGGPRPDTPALEGAGDSGHLVGAPLVPPGGPLEVAVGPAPGPTTAAGSGGSRGAVSQGSQGSHFMDHPGGGEGSPRGGWGLRNGVSRTCWSKEEDEALAAAVARHGAGNWALVASEAGLAPVRSGKACSLRWREYLDPLVNATRLAPFSEEETAVVLEAQEQYGNRWHAIAQLLPGRTATAVKNWWYSPHNPRYNGTPRSRRTSPHQDLSPRSTSSGELRRPPGAAHHPADVTPPPAAALSAPPALLPPSPRPAGSSTPSTLQQAHAAHAGPVAAGGGVDPVMAALAAALGLTPGAPDLAAVARMTAAALAARGGAPAVAAAPAPSHPGGSAAAAAAAGLTTAAGGPAGVKAAWGVKPEPRPSGSPGLYSSSAGVTAVVLPGLGPAAAAAVGGEGVTTPQSRLAMGSSSSSGLVPSPALLAPSAGPLPRSPSRMAPQPAAGQTSMFDLPSDSYTPRRGPIDGAFCASPGSPAARGSPNRADSALTQRSGSARPGTPVAAAALAVAKALPPHTQAQLAAAARSLHLPDPCEMSPSAAAGFYAACFEFFHMARPAAGAAQAAAGEAHNAAAAAAAAVLGRGRTAPPH